LNTIFERSKGHLIIFVAIAFISIFSRRRESLVVEELSARSIGRDSSPPLIGNGLSGEQA
jgi:transposase